MVDVSMVAEKKKHLESALRDIVGAITAYDSSIKEVVDYTVFPGGKRLRALLTVLMYEALGGNKGDIYRCACVPELIHIATLMLDDLPCMDDTSYRRDKLTSHKKFGESTTILAAFGLAAESFNILSDKNNLEGIDRQAALTMTQAITHKIGFAGLIGGQIADLNFGKNLRTCATDAERLEYIATNKTAVLFETCAIIAACLAQATPDDSKSLIAYTRNVGLALQIFDDLQDVAEDKVLSYPKVYGIEQTKKLLKEKITAAYACITQKNAAAQLLRELPHYLLEARG